MPCCKFKFSITGICSVDLPAYMSKKTVLVHVVSLYCYAILNPCLALQCNSPSCPTSYTWVWEDKIVHETCMYVIKLEIKSLGDLTSYLYLQMLEGRLEKLS